MRVAPVVAIAGVFFVLPSASDVESAANTRTIKLYFTHTKERADITFKRNGRYDASGLKKINHMLRDWRRNESTKMDPKLIDLLWEVHRETRSREPINVVSGFRSPVTNAALRKRSRGVAKNSQHTKGRATDFFIPGVPISKIREIGFRKQVGGVGYYPKSGSPFVHLDTGSVRAWPRMTRKQLLVLFPDGKTLHLPSDGKPLSGYAQAEQLERAGKLAQLDSRGDRGGTSGSRTRRNDGGGVKSGRNLLARIFTPEENEEEEAAARPDPPARSTPPRTESAPGVRTPPTPAAPPASASTPPLENAPLPPVRPRTVETLLAEAQIDETETETPVEETTVAVLLPQRRPADLDDVMPADAGPMVAELPSSRPENAEEAAAIAQAYAAASGGTDPLAEFIRGGRPLSELGEDAGGQTIASLLRRAVVPASMLEPYSDAPPHLTGSISLTRTGNTRFFSPPNQTDPASTFAAPHYLVVNAFGAMVPAPTVGSFEGRAIAPVAYRRIADSFVRSAALSAPATVR